MTRNVWLERVDVILSKNGLTRGLWEFFADPNEHQLSKPKEFAEYVLEELELEDNKD